MDGKVDSANETGNIKVQKTQDRLLVDVSCQTDFVTIDVDLPELKKKTSLPQLESEGLQEALTAESIAATAQSVLDKSGWVYDQSTGTYFDYNTNLYYYPQTRLYYNYKNGCYYRYNQEEQKYEFHYQLEAFKKKNQDLHQQEANTTTRSSKRLFPTLKKFELWTEKERCLLKQKSNGDTTAKDKTTCSSSAENCIELPTRRINAIRTSSTCTTEQLSDSESLCMTKKAKKFRLCKKCLKLTTTYCCQNVRLSESRRTQHEQKCYCSDSEIDMLSVSRTKYAQCSTCKSLALSACCDNVNFWLDKTTLSISGKRKSDVRKRKCKRRKRCTQSGDGSLTEKESENDCPDTDENELAKVEGNTNLLLPKDTFEGTKVEYSFNINDEDGEVQPDTESESNVIPCIRAMVTSSSSLKIGTLYLITCNGVVIGSDDQCDIHVQEETVSRKHAMITYNQEQKNYFVADLGSETGTTLNSTTEHNPGAKAVLMTPITHKSILLIGSCIFVLHLHLDKLGLPPGIFMTIQNAYPVKLESKSLCRQDPSFVHFTLMKPVCIDSQNVGSYETCDDCEPGQIQALLSQDQPTEAIHALSREEKEAIRWSELKSIKKKYGLHKERYKQREVFIGPRYTDRAADRRKTIGSDNPYEKDEISASYETELAEHNKGHQMLKKMGWNKGASLGKSQKGIIEPIKPQGSGKGKLGLGWAFKGQGT